MAVGKLLLPLAVLVLACAGIFAYATYHKTSAPTQSADSAANAGLQGGQPMLPTRAITIHGVPLTAEVASTPQEQESGLSGRSGLAGGTGMLFVFPEPMQVGFWMKDMRFSLDIIFADASGTIVTIHPNLAPDTYPQSFGPSSPAQYVLEVPAGFAAAHGIAVGQKIVLQ